MQRRTFLQTGCALAFAAALSCSLPAWAQTSVRVAVTNLAYEQQVSEYFVAASQNYKNKVNARDSHHGNAYGGGGQSSLQASAEGSGTYVAGRYSYIEQRDLAGYTNDIKGALLQGTYFKLVQGKAFDAGKPQPSKAEQVLNQVQTGKMATPVRQPSVNDIITRIKKGEFNGADYVLFGSVSSIEFTDALSPLQGTTNATYQFGLQLLADFSLINTRTYEIKAAFSAQGEGNDTKILSIRGDIAPPNRAKVMRETSRSLAQDVHDQLISQLGYSDPGMAGHVRPPRIGGHAPAGQPVPAQVPDQVIILR